MFEFLSVVLLNVFSLATPPQQDYALIFGDDGTNVIVSCVDNTLTEKSTLTLPNSTASSTALRKMTEMAVIDWSTPLSARKAYTCYKHATLSNTVNFARLDITNGIVTMDAGYPLTVTLGNGYVTDMDITPNFQKIAIVADSGTVGVVVDITTPTPTFTGMTGLSYGGSVIIPERGAVEVISNTQAVVLGVNKILGLPYVTNVVNLATGATVGAAAPVFGMGVPANVQNVGEMTFNGTFLFISTIYTTLANQAYGFTLCIPGTGNINVPIFFATGLPINFPSWYRHSVDPTGQFINFPGASNFLVSGLGAGYDLINGAVVPGFNTTPSTRGKGVLWHPTGLYVSFHTVLPTWTHYLTHFFTMPTTWTAAPGDILKTWRLNTNQIISYDSVSTASMCSFDIPTASYTVGPGTSCTNGISHIYPFDSY